MGTPPLEPVSPHRGDLPNLELGAALRVPESYRNKDLLRCCLFTGVEISDGARREHVIPRWLQKRPDSRGRDIEVVSAGTTAPQTTFMAPALHDKNQEFGVVEDRIRNRVASLDEIFLWSLKLSAGMLWSQYRLAQNRRHPHAPSSVDVRYLRMSLWTFHKGFADWERNSYARDGSVLVLPTALPNSTLVHVFGSAGRTDISTEFDVYSPYGLLAVAFDGVLYISTFHDPNHEFEKSSLAYEWSKRGGSRLMAEPVLRSTLATAFMKIIVSPTYERLFGRTATLKEFTDLAHAFGISVFKDVRGELRFRQRDNSLGGAISRATSDVVDYDRGEWYIQSAPKRDSQ